MIKELYKIDNNDKVRVWKAWTEGAVVVVSHGQQGGVMTESRYTAEEKGVGRSNYLSATEQAEKEVTALYKAQVDNHHYRYSAEEAVEVKGANLIPRKILNYKDGWTELGLAIHQAVL